MISGPTSTETTDGGFQKVVKQLIGAQVNTNGFNAALQDKFGKPNDANADIAATSFKTVSGPTNEDTNGDDFYALCSKLDGKSFSGITTPSFGDAQTKFGYQNQSSSAAGKFNDFANALTNATCRELQTNAGKFKEGASHFAEGANKFNDAAKQVQANTDDAGKLGQDQIPTKFKRAA